MANRRFDQFLFSLNPMLTMIEGSVSIGGPVYSGPTGPSLGAAESFAVLGSSTVTNTGGSVVSGDLGLYPGTSVVGFPPGTVINGVQHITDGTAAAAQLAITAAYVDLAARPFTTDLTGINLGGLTLTPGVYKFTTSAQLTGTLILDAQGNPNAIFVFQIGTTLTTASSSVVSLINSANAGKVFWNVGSSATLGTSTVFKGDIIAVASITLNTSASLDGRAFARTGAVTLDTNAVTKVSSLLPASGAVTSITGNGIQSVVKVGTGTYQVNFDDQYNRFLGLSAVFESPVAQGSAIASSALVPGQVYVIQSLGNTNWVTAGLSPNQVPAVGMAFAAVATSAGTGTAQVPGYSGIDYVEIIGNPDLTLSNHAPYNLANKLPYLIFQCLGDDESASDAPISLPRNPADGSVLFLNFMFRNSSIKGKGE